MSVASAALTETIDVAQVVLYAFWIFFFGLIFWLRREDRREGYPTESDTTTRIDDQSRLMIPAPKTFLLPHGGTAVAPDFARDKRELLAARISPAAGFPSNPVGDPMLSNVGPASYAQRADTVELTREGHNLIVPLRIAREFAFDAGPDPRGWSVVAADGKVAGVVKDLLGRPGRRDGALPRGGVARRRRGRRAAPLPDHQPAHLGRPAQRAGRGGAVGPLRAGAAAQGARPDHHAGRGEDLRLLRGRTPLRRSQAAGAFAVSAEIEIEPIPGLPNQLPPGEALLWQGRPRWWPLARGTFHLQGLALYFAVFTAARGVVALRAGKGLVAALAASAMVVPLALFCLGLLALLALLHARATVYSITSRRVVMRFGIAFPMTFNLPFRRLAAADLKTGRGSCGDIALALAGPGRIAYAHLWPHARPWHFKRAQPLLRAIPDATRVAALLGDAVRAWSQAEHAPVLFAAGARDASSPQPPNAQVAVAAPLTAPDAAALPAPARASALTHAASR